MKTDESSKKISLFIPFFTLYKIICVRDWKNKIIMTKNERSTSDLF